MAAMLVMSGCAKDEPEEQVGGIYGVITDKATGEPIRSAGVQLNPLGLKTTTGNDGQYQFDDLKPGNYSLQATKTGYKDLVNHNITVVAGKTAKGDVQMEKLPASLRVVNDNKQDISTLDFGNADADITRSFSIFNDGIESIEWEITNTSEWITKISKENGTLKAGATQGIVITIDRNKLSGGENTTTIQVTSDNGSKALTVKAIGYEKVTLNTLEVTNIATSTATFNGKITDVGTPKYTERGFVYSMSSTPTIENTIAKMTALITENTEYSANINGLTLDKTYYVRAYAINRAGTAYSTNEMSFTTTEVLPNVTTQEVSNIDVTSATLNGTIVNMGDPAYTERGFVYATFTNPNIANGTKQIVLGSGMGIYDVSLTGLAQGTIYYVRAYATNSKGTAYGTQVSFKAESLYFVTLSATGLAVDKADASSSTVDWYNATSLCEKSTHAGFNDWRLPSIDELYALNENKDVLPNMTYRYWSSDESGYVMNWGTGVLVSVPTIWFANCRCVRTLP